MTSTDKPADDLVVERDDRDRAARQARVTEKTGSALRPPAGSIPAPARPASAAGSAAGSAQAAPPAVPDGLAPLFGKGMADNFRKRLRETNALFVEDPAGAVSRADTLLDEAVQQLTAALTKRREELARQRQGGDTEQLRLALLRYRAALDSVISQ
ncbi:hypothetical protein [Yinghuangia seranimata]|uniref:hypothetical protein n=1 Tax=Yinghuangia seranimata TaxID=408067 RepID=UPI00248CE661|nr:hypothetical protein [Yinghuangia seranimata]MDI2130255.1 hypothetical protein [Yinghuangia seranimata]